MDPGTEQLLNPATGVNSDYTITLTSSNVEKDSIFDMPTPGDSSMFGGFQILLNTCIGSGTLMVPYCFTTGVGTELIISAIFCLVAFMALYFLIEASQYSGTYDYFDIFRSCFGKKHLWFLNLSVFLVQWGTVVIYCLWNGRLLKKLVGSSNPILYSNAFWSFLIATFAIFPLTIFRSLAKLESFASISTFFILLLIVHAFYFFVHDLVQDGFDPAGEFQLFDFRTEVVISALSVNSMAFFCHLNLFSTLEHLKRPTLKRALSLCGLTNGVSYLLYSLFGLFSYLNLFDKIKAGSSLEYYTHPNWFTKVTIVGVVVVLIVSSPLVLWAARFGFNNLIWKDKPMTPIRWICIGGGLTLIAALLASSSEDVVFFFDIVGGFFTPTIEFVFPAIFFLKIQRGAPKWKIAIAVIVLVSSIVAIVACLYQAVKEIIDAVHGN